MIRKLITLFKLGRKIAKSDILSITSKFKKPPLAIKIIFQILSFSFSKKEQRDFNQNEGERLSSSLESMGTTFIKLGQFLATRPDIIGEELSSKLENLQDRLPAFSINQAKEIIRNDLGDDTYNSIIDLSEPVAAASIAQVHKAKINDDIYVTGNLGDSYVGLQILQNKIKTTKKNKKYFIKKYFEPEIQIKLTRKLLKFANSSIDISDGLIDDLKKLMNRQKLSYKILEEKIPISNNLLNYLKKNNFKKTDFVSNGDDYQILFTASADKARIIKNTSKKLGVKISRIGIIRPNNQKSLFIGQKGQHLLLKNSGYKHQF